VSYRERARTYKYICTRKGHSLREEAYDLNEDPGERRTIVSTLDSRIAAYLPRQFGDAVCRLVADPEGRYLISYFVFDPARGLGAFGAPGAVMP